MPLVAIAAVVLAAMGAAMEFFMAAAVPGSAGDPDVQARAFAENMLVWHAAAREYAESHPSYAGTITDPGVLPLPGWYVPIESWTTEVDGGVVATWHDGGRLPPGVLAPALEAVSGYDPAAGHAEGGRVVSSRHGATMALPAAVPEGAAVIAARVH